MTFEYDVKGRMVKKTDQFGLSYEFSYDSNGNLLSEKDPKGQVKTYAYDDLNQLTQVTLPDDQIFYAYNVKREIIRAENSTSQVLYTRNSKIGAIEKEKPRRTCFELMCRRHFNLYGKGAAKTLSSLP